MSHSASNQSVKVPQLISRQWTLSCTARYSFFWDLLPITIFSLCSSLNWDNLNSRANNLSQLCLPSNYSGDFCAVTAPLQAQPLQLAFPAGRSSNRARHCLSKHPAGQLLSRVPLPVRVSIWIWEDELFFILHVPGPRLSSYHENTNQWLTEMAITKRFLATLLFIQTLILHRNSHLFLTHACTLSKLWKYNFITMDLPQRAKLSQKSIQVCWQKAKC